MATVHIPTPMRVATDGVARVEIEGATVREIVDRLEASYPGLGGRLVEDGQLRPGLSVFVDGANVGRRLRTKLQPDSELFFVEALGGGAPSNRDSGPLSLSLWRPWHNPRDRRPVSIASKGRAASPSPRGEENSGVFASRR